jgi:hypothetical protein
MALFTTVKKLGLKVYDTRAHVNLTKLRPEFARLAVDPYVREGFRRKHIMWLEKGGEGFNVIERNTLLQDKATNPIHGGIERVYPRIESWDRERETMTRLVRMFTDMAGTPDGKEILMQFQRITCEPGKPGLPSVENWHQDRVSHIAVLCVERENVRGGMSQFKNDAGDFYKTELAPGFMVVFKDADVWHRVTEIFSQDGDNGGVRDVILLADY